MSFDSGGNGSVVCYIYRDSLSAQLDVEIKDYMLSRKVFADVIETAFEIVTFLTRVFFLITRFIEQSVIIKYFVMKKLVRTS